MKMMVVPFAECKESFGTYYGTPARESWSYSSLECEVDDKTTADDLFEAWDKALSEAQDEDERFEIGDWIQVGPHGYRSRVDGFAIVKPEIIEMLNDVQADVNSDGGGDAIADFQLAFCVKHADRLVKVVKTE